MIDPLHALSPVDGRYAEMTAPLKELFSEFAFLRDRVRVELDYLTALSKAGLTRALSVPEAALLESIQLNFSTADAESIQAHMRALRAVGVPYTDAEIAAAPAEVKGKTELDAMVAYLQGLGLALK